MIEKESFHQDLDVNSGKFKRPVYKRLFRGQSIPTDFDIDVDENDYLEEGQKIGSTRSGGILYWLYNAVVSKWK